MELDRIHKDHHIASFNLWLNQYDYIKTLEQKLREVSEVIGFYAVIGLKARQWQATNKDLLKSLGEK